MMMFGSDAAHAADVGGKASSLGRLVEWGFDVPAFFVLPSGAVFDVDLLERALDRLGDGPYAVRSSGLSEDPKLPFLSYVARKSTQARRSTPHCKLPNTGFRPTNMRAFWYFSFFNTSKMDVV